MHAGSYAHAMTTYIFILYILHKATAAYFANQLTLVRSLVTLLTPWEK